jgi:hypothetical protein
VTDPPPATGGVRAVTLPAVELALTTHAGDHDTIEVTYGRLGGWFVDHALSVAGPVREGYPVGPRDTPTRHAGAPRSAGRSSESRPTESPSPRGRSGMIQGRQAQNDLVIALDFEKALWNSRYGQ